MKRTQTTLWHASLFVGVCVISLGLSLARAAGKESGKETHRRRIIRHQLQSLPCGTVSDRVQLRPVADAVDPHARAGQPAREAGEGNPEVYEGRGRQLISAFNRQKLFMKKNFNSRILGTAASCVLGLTVSPRASAAISDEDFNALKSTVQQLQSERAQDKQQIQQLQQQLGETQSLATNAVEKADAVAQAQATPVRNALHNFTMVGDAEIQYAKTFGNNTHSGFLLADFAPIFLYRANDNILFEAGFDVMLQNGAEPVSGHDSGSSTSVGI